MRKTNDHSSKPETPDGISALMLPHHLLLAVIVIVLILSVAWLQVEQTRPLVFALILVGLIAAFVDLRRRELRWQSQVSELNAELRHAMAEGDTLAEISKEFSGEVDTDALFSLVARRARELLGADYASLAVVDGATSDTLIVATVGESADVVWTKPRAPGQGLAGKAIASRRPVVVESFGSNPDFPVIEYPLHQAEGMVAALAMPVMRGSKALGALTVAYRRPHSFTEEEVTTIEALAAQSGVALENAMLYGEQKHRVAELEAVLDHMSDGVIVTDRAGRVLRCNSAASQLFGGVMPGADLLKPDWQVDLQVDGPDGNPLASEDWPLARAARGEEFTGREVTVRRSDARPHHVSVDGRPVLDSKGDVVLGVTVIHDVTAAREMDQLKDEFLSLAAHELKTPLTSLKGYAQMLLSAQDESLGELKRRALQVMDRQVDRVNQMVEQFLLVEEIRSGRLMLHPEQVELAEVVDRACVRVDGAASGRKVEQNVSGPVYVSADHRSLDLVLSNLLDNAVKFSPEGSTISVSLMAQGGEAVVCVRDSGVGIPKDKQGYVFDRFYQVQPGTQRGVGLGLYISQELVSSHGGRMWLESETGNGSRFYFSLPLAEAQRRVSGG